MTLYLPKGSLPIRLLVWRQLIRSEDHDFAATLVGCWGSFGGLNPYSCGSNMKPKLTKKVKVLETRKWNYGKYTLVENRTNGKLKDQHFISNKPKKTHPFTYMAKNATFRTAKTIEDPENFKDFDTCVCEWETMDSWNWTLTDKYPLPSSFRVDYVGGITNEDFDLAEVMQGLQGIRWISKIELIDIPYYNAEYCRNKAIEFTALVDEKLIHYLFDNSKASVVKDEFGYWGWSKEGLDILGIRHLIK